MGSGWLSAVFVVGGGKFVGKHNAFMPAGIRRDMAWNAADRPNACGKPVWRWPEAEPEPPLTLTLKPRAAAAAWLA